MNSATVSFIVIGVFLIAVFDIFQLVHKGSQATISHTLYAGAQKYPIIPFAIGVVAGHLFWVNA